MLLVIACIAVEEFIFFFHFCCKTSRKWHRRSQQSFVLLTFFRSPSIPMLWSFVFFCLFRIIVTIVGSNFICDTANECWEISGIINGWYAFFHSSGSILYSFLCMSQGLILPDLGYQIQCGGLTMPSMIKSSSGS